MPVDKETSVAHFLDLPPPVVEKVQRFVFAMGRRFGQLRGETATR
jgi:hypothetical protein